MKRILYFCMALAMICFTGCEKRVSNQNTTANEKISQSMSSEVNGEQVIINVACVENYSEFTAYASEFNQNQTEYCVNLLDYSGDKGDTFDYINQLHLDIVSGNAPDVIISSNDDAVNTLISKGVFADLYDFLDTDAEVSRADILPNVLKAMETDGKLYSLTDQFIVRTLGVKQSKYNSSGWTIDELMSYYQTLPEGTAFSMLSNSKMAIFYMLFLDSNYVDYKNFTCNFNSDSFIRFLEFCNMFPENSEELDIDAIRTDAALCYGLDIGSFRNYGDYKADTFGGEEINFVGYPCEDRNGGYIQSTNRFSILENSDQKKGAWEFVKTFFTESYQNTIYQTGIPVRESSYKLITENSMSDQQLYVLPDGTQEYGDTIEAVLTDEEYAYFDSYVRSLNKFSGSSYHTDLKSICAEEVGPYFSSEIAAERAAELIQSRVSIMLSEAS